MDAIAVFMTAGNEDEANRIAELLVEKQLAACVQIIPRITSVYRWKGHVERQDEVFLIAKTVAQNFAALENAVRAIHSYETPEIVAVPITDGSPAYLEWLQENVS